MLQKCLNLLTSKISVQLNINRLKHYKYISIAHKQRRIEQGLPSNPACATQLLDGADYTFIDGRLSPLGMGQKKRLLENEAAKQQIIALSQEIDFAVDRYKQVQAEEEQRKKAILDAKLKPKGTALINN